MKQFYQTWWALQFTKVIKNKQTNKQTKQKQNQTIIWPYWFIVFRKKKNNKRYWIARNHLSWHSLNLQMLQKWLEENMEMHVAEKSQEKYWQSSCVFLFRYTIMRTQTKMSDVLHNHYTLLTLVPPGRGVGLDLPVPVQRVSPLLPIQQAPQQSSPLFPEVKINWLQLKQKKRPLNYIFALFNETLALWWILATISQKIS